jgi:PAS domain-containing protein
MHALPLRCLAVGLTLAVGILLSLDPFAGLLFAGLLATCSLVGLRRIARRKGLQQQIEFTLGTTRTGLDIIDSEFNLRYVAPGWQKVLGDPVGRKCYRYFMGRSEVCPDCGFPKALETEAAAVTEEALAGEGNRCIQVSPVPFQDEDGEWLVAEVNVDSAGRERAEEAARESEERYHVLFNTSDDTILVTEVLCSGLSGEIIEVNDALCRKLGYTSRGRSLCLPSLGGGAGTGTRPYSTVPGRPDDPQALGESLLASTRSADPSHGFQAPREGTGGRRCPQFRLPSRGAWNPREGGRAAAARRPGPGTTGTGEKP